jgi:Tfp pilus assembly protein PilX
MSLCNENGIALVAGLLVVVVLLLLGTTAVLTSTTDLKISSNNKTGVQAFFAAEAGIEEARARLRLANPQNPNLIADAYRTESQWNAYIGTSGNAQGMGYDNGNSLHVQVASLQSALAYTVKIQHRTNNGGQILYWGDENGDGINERTVNPVGLTGFANPNIYLATSHGTAPDSNKVVVAEITKVPPFTVPGPLYVEATTTIQGTSTNIIGIDQCGGQNVPGVSTTLAANTVGRNGNPSITGSTSPTGSPPSIVGGVTNINVQAMIDSQKDSANYRYTVSGATHTGMNWGAPVPGATQQDASSCNVKNIVHYNTNNTYIRLTGGSTGCGILLIEGDLELHGGFLWHGVVLVSGNIIFTGGGGKNITGGVLAGGSADVDIVGGDANIIYCSSAISNQTEYQPLRRLSWKEKNI